jgi:acylpyruvate hydrolase
MAGRGPRKASCGGAKRPREIIKEEAVVKIVLFGPDRRTGALRDTTVVDLSGAFAKFLRERNGERHPIILAEALVPSDLGRFIEGGAQTLDNAQRALDYLFSEANNQLGPRGEKLVHPISEVRLHAPRATSAGVACAGSNYADHAVAMAARNPGGENKSLDFRDDLRKRGIWGFWKVNRDSVGPDGDVYYPARTHRLDYEGEAAVIIGKPGRNISAARATDHIWGVTLSADWSIRDQPEPPGPLKFAMVKNFDTSHSLGPCIAVGEVAADNVEVETLVNGERRQHYNTRSMVFGFGDLIEYLSQDFTLYPGDIISGGTAAGTAADSSPRAPDGTFPPERFLKPGDTVEVRSSAVGTLLAHIVTRKD